MKKKFFIMLVIIILVVILGATIILGRYLQEHQKSSLYEAENFYFTSDLLKEESDVSFGKMGLIN